MHEQSETIERDGKFFNVYGRDTPKAGQDLPGERPYDTMGDAVTAAKARSHSFDNPFDDIPTVGKADPFADLPTVEKSTPMKGSATAGAVEAALGIGSNIAGNVAGLGYAIGTGDPDVMAPIAESMTYEPRTKRGKAMSEIVAAPFQKLDEFAEWLGEQNREASKSPAFSAGVKTAIDALPFFFGARGRAPEARTAERPAGGPAPQPEAQPAPAAPPERPFPIPPVEEPAVRPEGNIRRTKPEPGAAGMEDPFADLPNAGNLDDVPALNVRGAPTMASLLAEADRKSGPMPGAGPEVFDPAGQTPEAIREKVAERERARIAKESVEESPVGEGAILTDEEAEKRYGPGTLSANPFDPALAKEGVKALGETAGEVLNNALGTPGKDRNLFSPILREEQYRVAQADRWATGESYVVRKEFPKLKDREELTLGIVRGVLPPMTERQFAVAQRLIKNYQQAGQYLLDTRAIAGLRTNYSPQMWDTNHGPTRRIIEMWREARDKGPIRENSPLVSDRGGSGTFSPFLLERAIENVEEGMKLGLKPKSLDAAALFETYIRSTVRAVERGKAFKSLGELMTDEGVPVQMPTKQAPRDYVSIRNPEFEGYRFQPDAAPAIKVAYETDNPWLISKALQMAAYASKRALMSYSGFHAMSLTLVRYSTWTKGMELNPKTAIDSALKIYREGGPGDTVDKLLHEGFRIGVPMDDLLGRERFTRLLDKVEGLLDKARAGAPVRMPREADQALQRFTWDYLHTGNKVDIAVRLVDLKLAQNAERIARGEVTEQAIYRQVSEAVNSFEGGQNWERMIEKFDTPIGRQIMAEVLSKSGRRWMQTFLLAPDWKVSTISSWTNALTGGEQAAIRRQLARRYLLTSAIITYTYGNALNYYFTGHSMFENKSKKKDATTLDNLKAKTQIQLRDGRHINPNKHFLDAPHVAMDPINFSLSSMNPVVSEPIEQIANKQYLTTGYAPPITERRDRQLTALKKRAAHAAGKFVPIAAQQILQQGVPAAVSGFSGFPVSGVTEEQKRREADQRAVDRAMGR